MGRKVHFNARSSEEDKGTRIPEGGPAQRTADLPTMGRASNRIADDEEPIMLDILTQDNTSTVNVSRGEETEHGMELQAPKIALSQTELKPPFTKIHLLLMEEMVRSPSIELCHELIFSSKIKLRLQSVRDDIKQNQGNSPFWDIIHTEIRSIYSTDKPQKFVALEALLTEIRDMLIHLYPDSKFLKDDLLPAFDVQFLIQQITQGSLDAHSLASSLASVIKANCAPKRDCLVEHMLGLAKIGDWVNMFKSCLDLIELMKLDLLNYHLTLQRKSLIRDHVQREREHFDSLFGDVVFKMTLSTTTLWLQSKRTEPRLDQSEGDHAFELVREAFIDMIMGTPGSPIPETFNLDLGRIRDLRTAIQDICIIASAMVMFQQWCGRKPTGLALSEMKSRLIKALAKSDCTISDMGRAILLVASRVRGNQIGGANRELLFSMLDSIMNPSQRVYQTVRTKVRDALLMQLSGQRTIHFDKMGLLSVQIDIIGLSSIINTLWNIHWRVHGERYQRILTTLDRNIEP